MHNGDESNEMAPSVPYWKVLLIHRGGTLPTTDLIQRFGQHICDKLKDGNVPRRRLYVQMLLDEVIAIAP